jgi:hypothetical protein
MFKFIWEGILRLISVMRANAKIAKPIEKSFCYAHQAKLVKLLIRTVFG